jgi:hypothetical protein
MSDDFCCWRISPQAANDRGSPAFFCGSETLARADRDDFDFDQHGGGGQGGYLEGAAGGFIRLFFVPETLCSRP